jgi:type VI secretion system protein ImpE
MVTMQAEQLLREGRPDEALELLQREIRKKPADKKLRVFLFQLLCVQGDWSRALNQLNVVLEMDPKNMLLGALYRPALQSEALRTEIFAGKRSPVIFGQPEEWMGLIVQACQLEAQGKFEQAGALRDTAFEAAPTTSGKINGEPFEWIADADTRLGPLFEAVINGTLFWVPYTRVHRMFLEDPTDLRDAIWFPATITWTNGGEVGALLPVRYPGSESSEDALVRLARKTEWADAPGGAQRGLGQRIIATDAGEYPLLEVRKLELDNEVTGGGGDGASFSVGLTSG